MLEITSNSLHYLHVFLLHVSLYFTSISSTYINSSESMSGDKDSQSKKCLAQPNRTTRDTGLTARKFLCSMLYNGQLVSPGKQSIYSGGLRDVCLDIAPGSSSHSSGNLRNGDTEQQMRAWMMKRLSTIDKEVHGAGSWTLDLFTSED